LIADHHIIFQPVGLCHLNSRPQETPPPGREYLSGIEIIHTVEGALEARVSWSSRGVSRIVRRSAICCCAAHDTREARPRLRQRRNPGISII
jgi:hypothetical protein